MNDKLTIQELAAYLPWEVEATYFDADRELIQFCKVRGWNTDELTISDGEYEYVVEFDDIKLCLLPLSHLTKEIEHKGEKFVPIEELDKYHDFSILNYKDIMSTPLRYPYTVVQKLLEWKFDIFGLLERGLAIDKTTIQC